MLLADSWDRPDATRRRPRCQVRSIGLGALWLAVLAGAPPSAIGCAAAAADMTDPAVSVALTGVTYGELPGWQNDDHRAALQAFVASCPRLDDRCRDALAATCAAASALAAEGPTRRAARAFFERHFVPHRLLHQGPAGLLTGYYEPQLRASRVPVAPFRVPIYRRPAELVNLVDEAARGAVGGDLTHARRTATGHEPYFTRQEIEDGALVGRGLELGYVADPVDLFLMQVQGSGRLRLPDGTRVRITYDGKNGYPYTSIGRQLIDAGEITAEAMSLDTLAAWLRADPIRGREMMWRNRSYVFFRELSGPEAESALGVRSIPLTRGRSLAVDTRVHDIGLPIYVSSETLTHISRQVPGRARGFHRLMVAQDVGSAIRGPERGDIFLGSGVRAGAQAGITKHAGRFFVLRPRSELRGDAP